MYKIPLTLIAGILVGLFFLNFDSFLVTTAALEWIMAVTLLIAIHYRGKNRPIKPNTILFSIAEPNHKIGFSYVTSTHVMFLRSGILAVAALLHPAISLLGIFTLVPMREKEEK